MKKFIISAMVFTSAVLISCNSQTTKEDESGKSESFKPEITASTEKDAEINTKPIKLTRQDFLNKIMDYESNPQVWNYKGELPGIIDFYADWCAPCRTTSPILEELAGEYAGRINVYKVDVDAEKELAAVFGIQGIPSFLFIPMEGNPSMTSGIARTKEETKQLFVDNIEKLLLNNSDTRP